MIANGVDRNSVPEGLSLETGVKGRVLVEEDRHAGLMGVGSTSWVGHQAWHCREIIGGKENSMSGMRNRNIVMT